MSLGISFSGENTKNTDPTKTGIMGTYNKLATKLAAKIAKDAAPGSAHVHMIPGSGEPLIFLPNGSRLFRGNPEQTAFISSLLSSKDDASIALGLLGMEIDGPVLIDDTIPDPPLHALSLAISQSCNMGCSYCYAGQGEFGTGAASSMNAEMAFKAVDLLLKDKTAGDKVQLSFLGGEPLMNRSGIRMATAYASKQALARGVDIGFSITSNGTLIREEDASFFEEYGFAVTISLDGLKEEHDRIRTFKNGKGTYDQVMANISPLLSLQKRMQVSARVTVTPMNMELHKALDTFINMGFHSVGFSPLLRADNGANEMSTYDLEHLLAEMIACGLQFEEAVLNGRRYPFLNMVNAYKEIAKSTHRPYPCGAGAGYLGVSANGELAACHRFVNDSRAEMGSVDKGVDAALQQAWLTERHVHHQQPCSGCWARYLCGGGCHHEVLERGRSACDYIRGWLHYTLQSYERINRLMPGYDKV